MSISGFTPPEASVSLAKTIFSPGEEELLEEGVVRSVEARGDCWILHPLDGRSLNEWILPDQHQFPVDFQSLSRLVNQLVDAEVVRFVTRKEDRLSRLDPRSSSLLFFTGPERDSPALSLHFGKRSDRGGMYVQFGDDPAAYLIAESVYLASRPDDWIDKSLFPFKSDEISAVSVDLKKPDPAPSIRLERDHATGEYALAGDLAGQWTPNQETIRSWLDTLSSMQFTSYTEASGDEAVEAKSFARTYSVQTADGSEWRISIGRRPEETIEPGEEPESGEDSDAVSQEPSTLPAGTPYVFIEKVSTSGESSIPYADLAFEIPSYSFTRQPEDEDWLTAVAQETEDSESTP